MKKALISISAALMLLSPFAGQASAAESKVAWKGNEIKVNQLGVVHFVKDVKTYKRNPEGEIISVERGKAGLAYRVYSIVKKGDTIVYNIGANTQVQQTNLVKYEQVPVEIRSKFFNAGTKAPDFDYVEYPQFTGFSTSQIVNEKIEKIINEHIQNNQTHIFMTTYETNFDDKEGKLLTLLFRHWFSSNYHEVAQKYLINLNNGEVTRLSTIVY
ncbi:hypothetical protein [Metabacillus iocasae]|uniref:Uncharacterized protein n=1 Tax=Priestia iocasae TaxID=2291674 RepID=A0ABS2QQ54_9BACI|nr:hypothetical protein [Metabacillus iocasae]MBM7701595.1 hypothetical protein [Metabacillus iocasae]